MFDVYAGRPSMKLVQVGDEVRRRVSKLGPKKAKARRRGRANTVGTFLPGRLRPSFAAVAVAYISDCLSWPSVGEVAYRR
jgi:hypothetical protein